MQDVRRARRTRNVHFPRCAVLVIVSVFQCKRDRRNDAEERGLLADGAGGAVIVVLELDGEGVVAVVGIIDAERPDTGKTLSQLLRVIGTKVQTVVGRSPITVTLIKIIIGESYE